MIKFKQFMESEEREYWEKEAEFFIDFILENNNYAIEVDPFFNKKIIKELGNQCKKIFYDCLVELNMDSFIEAFKAGKYDEIYEDARRDDHFDEVYMQEIEDYFNSVLFDPGIALLELLFNLEPHKFVQYYISIMKQNFGLRKSFKNIKNSYEFQDRMLKIDPGCYKYIDGIHPEIRKKYSHLEMGNKFGVFDEEV